MNDDIGKVEGKLGKPRRINYKNKYEDYFIIVGYDINNQAAMIYTNHDLFQVKKNGVPMELSHPNIGSTFGDPSISYSQSYSI